MPEIARAEVLDKGFVKLESAMADDLSVVNSARVSYGNYVDAMRESDEKLIGYLMKNRHGTPFEHNAFRFHVKAPIFIFREWQRHRIGSYNEMSARYTQLPAEWYIPAADNVRMRVGKPGHYTYKSASALKAGAFIAHLKSDCKNSYSNYENALEEGIAPEQARLFLHVNHYSEMWWTVNARSLMNFLSLRNADTAMWEIRQYALAVEDMFSMLMPVTHAAFASAGRVAP